MHSSRAARYVQRSSHAHKLPQCNGSVNIRRPLRPSPNLRRCSWQSQSWQSQASGVAFRHVHYTRNSVPLTCTTLLQDHSHSAQHPKYATCTARYHTLHRCAAHVQSTGGPSPFGVGLSRFRLGRSQLSSICFQLRQLFIEGGLHLRALESSIGVGVHAFHRHNRPRLGGVRLQLRKLLVEGGLRLHTMKRVCC